ncbi:MAG: CRTAC1 family protein [Micromonosporaceae bacterium]
MSTAVSWLRRQLPGVIALGLMLSLFAAGGPSGASAADLEAMARKFSFTPLSINLPGGFGQQSIRKVNQDYKHIDAWVSSVGAGIAMNDLDGDGLSNDLCVTDPRIDQVVITPTPGKGDDRYQPFALRSDPLPMSEATAPMGCAPGDFNEDGRMDLLVYFWGRTPIAHLARADTSGLDAQAYRPVELVPGAGGDRYTGPQWNSNAVAIADYDGDGHDDIYLGNYFPHGPVLDHTVSGGVAMNQSLSRAFNGGEDYFFRFTGGSGGVEPDVSYQKLDNVLPRDISKGWVLAAGANDLDGDQLSELYIAADHGPDSLLHNRSTPGKIKFAPVRGVRQPMQPKSKRVGMDSFKGMGIDFADLNHDGVYDMFISDITTPYGIQESNLAYLSTVDSEAQLRANLKQGTAPWEDHSTQLGVAWSGWAWDLKMADFNNSGEVQIAQSTGFVKGDVNRWAMLQEVATANDLLLEHPEWWPHVNKGDDIAGSQVLAFFAKGPDGQYQNLSEQLGLAVPVPTRGIATGDSDGDGRLDFAVARQWDEPVFYHNESPSPGAFLGLRLTHEAGADASAPGSPVTGAQVRVTTSDGRSFMARVDGGSGHSGKRSHEVHIGLGKDVTGPLQVRLEWRDRAGQIHEQELSLTPGWHSLQLGAQAQER